MSVPAAIGLDLGGTKLLTGVVDADLNVLHESREASTGASEQEVVDTIVEEVEEARAKFPDIVGVGLGIPCTIDRERGVAINAVNWGGPPVGALVFRDPAMINTFTSVSTNPYATGPSRLEVGVHQYGLLGGFVASIEYLASLDESARGTRRERLSTSIQSATTYLRVSRRHHGAGRHWSGTNVVSISIGFAMHD